MLVYQRVTIVLLISSVLKLGYDIWWQNSVKCTSAWCSFIKIHWGIHIIYICVCVTLITFFGMHQSIYKYPATPTGVNWAWLSLHSPIAMKGFFVPKSNAKDKVTRTGLPAARMMSHSWLATNIRFLPAKDVGWNIVKPTNLMDM